MSNFGNAPARWGVPFDKLNTESVELLLSDPRKQQITSCATEDSPRHSKLTSTWRAYWKTPSTLLGLYFSAWIIAIFHLAIFIWLNNNRADGPHSISQSNVAALSHLLGLLFRISLCGSLAIAFTQYLWRLMRIKTIKVSSIELLFKVTQNPLLLALTDVVKTAPALFVLALFSWILPIAVIFPPGALIIVPSSAPSSYNATVPTYNGSSVGNGSMADSQLKSLAARRLSGGYWLYLGPQPFLRRIGRLTLELGDIVSSSSPCGPDCSYITQFNGPYLRCNNTIFNETKPDMGTEECAYNTFSAAFSGSLPDANFVDRIIQENHTTTCISSRASYTVKTTYLGDVRAISHSVRYLDSSQSMFSPVDQFIPATPACNMTESFNSSENPYGGDQCMNQAPANWSQPLLDNFEALNHLALIDAIVSPLNSQYTMIYDGSYANSGDSFVVCGPKGDTLVADTRLNAQRDNFSRTAHDGPVFVLTQDILNDALINLTISATHQFGFWADTVAVNIASHYNVYSFAAPHQLLMPYLLCLFISIPFLFLGLSSLRLNGVSAIQGGFLQILTTTTGSKTLEKAAAGGCLGGEENVPDDLKEIKIRFGELVRSGGGENDESWLWNGG